MIKVELFLAAIVVAVVGIAAAVAAFQRNGPRQPEVPTNTELARAVRLLDRILAVDDAFPQLPTDLRDEAKRITATYYRELDP